jgi:hypothetical protein
MENPDITDAENKFADVPDGEWYTEAVIWAETNGIVTGVSETEFAPNENVTREQMATILYRYAKTKGYTLDTATDLSVFTDINEISRFAIDAIRWANKTELVNGTSETMLSPKATATRAQVAAILMRFCENVAK